MFMERADAERLMRLWGAKKNIIIQGPPGVGKSFAAQRLAFALMEAHDPNRIGFVQFHQSYSYEDFVEGYRPTETGFELRSGKFVEFCQRAANDLDRKYVFIIDEINRGNLSKILGELMLLIESDKRDRTWMMRLASGREEFFVPPNVYLLGLMNTADRSLAVVDYALRRRFAFIDLAPNLGSARFKSYLASIGISDRLSSGIITRIGQLNAEIVADLANLGPGFAIGHSYFCAKPVAHETEQDWYERIVETEIVPLLREYWFDTPQKADSWNAQLLAPL
jgi:DNA polymerase III delta prime subunit